MPITHDRRISSIRPTIKAFSLLTLLFVASLYWVAGVSVQADGMPETTLEQENIGDYSEAVPFNEKTPESQWQSGSKAEKKAASAQVQEENEAYVMVTLQPGTLFLAMAETPVRTDYNHVGDRVEARLINPVYVGAIQVMDPSTRFIGSVAVLEKPIEGKDAVLGIRFDSVVLATGDEKPLAAHINTDEKRQVWGGDLRPGTKPFSVSHRVMGIGWYNKTILGGPREMGRHYEVKPGETWRVILETPLTFSVPKPRYRQKNGRF